MLQIAIFLLLLIKLVYSQDDRMQILSPKEIMSTQLDDIIKGLATSFEFVDGIVDDYIYVNT